MLWNSDDSGGFAMQDLGAVDKSWRIAGGGDFNGDGQADVLWRNTSGEAAIWDSNGSGGFTAHDLGVVDKSWQIAGVGDYNGDGKADILWSNTGGGTAIWNSASSGNFTGQVLTSAPFDGWNIQRT
jgi:FG-GAP-like repeat